MEECEIAGFPDYRRYGFVFRILSPGMQGVLLQTRYLPRIPAGMVTGAPTHMHATRVGTLGRNPNSQGHDNKVPKIL